MASAERMNTTAAMVAHMAPSRSTTPDQLARLIDVHLGDLREEQPNWMLAPSPVAGRGVFATRDIAAGELIFRERALVVGPTARKGSQLNTCVCCHRLLASKHFLCPHHCTLPVCGECADSAAHRNECEHFQRWMPKDLTASEEQPPAKEPPSAEGDPQDVATKEPLGDVVNPLSLRILTAVRVFYLSKEQRALVDAMQANAERGYRQEIIKAAQCFRKFPTTDKPFMDQLFRVVGVLNTNAFEAPCRVDKHETLLRGLFPLTAIMNHECTPNASHYFENGRLAVVRAARDIPKGGEITTTYTKILWSNLTRGIFLKMTKYFVCNCDRCNDNSENGTYLSALFCREQGCKGLVIPVQTKTLQPDWRCLSCENVFPHAKMARYQDFALNTINNRINTCSVRDMIHFINELCPRFCPPSNYVLIEAKLNVIWRMTRLGAEEYAPEELAHKDRYREEILAILHKLGAGECTLKKLITEEIQ
ncbi:SET domain-containing protein SmydA-8 isoform X1 [Drosophila albomicans]|uniref:SET domain-containing protein SmydA-8 isoform X1 n=1 Tax=Drosophila albomicans TaxID=7291 RepID=A0A6P8XIS1_DROAB|nr:SET domain-containing protein SmydA-8 isoform X1 [Drosophila albomicans]